MLVDLPDDMALAYNYSTPPPLHKPPGERMFLSKRERKREAFMMCALTLAPNEASKYFKGCSCDGVTGTNYNRTVDLWNV